MVSLSICWGFTGTRSIANPGHKPLCTSRWITARWIYSPSRRSRHYGVALRYHDLHRQAMGTDGQPGDIHPGCYLGFIEFIQVGLHSGKIDVDFKSYRYYIA